MDPRHLSILDYTYPLPDDLIAVVPKAERDSSRLLIWKDATPTTDVFRNISHHLPADSLIIFNNTRVIKARLLFEKPTGAKIEIFLLEPSGGNFSAALITTESVVWKCMVGNASSWTRNLVLSKKISSGAGEIGLKAQVVSQEHDHFLISLSWTPANLSFAEVLHYAGSIPLPPYIKRKVTEEDAERYQTVYADAPGSVAAPTAGLHFTDQTLLSLASKNIKRDFVTLHVGAGTFKPVKSETMKDHLMHSESIEINLSLIKNLQQFTGRKIIAVGTTSLRTLESIYWLGNKLSSVIINDEVGEVGQWDPYDNKNNITTQESLQRLSDYMQKFKLEKLVFKTSLIIAPGYKFRMVDILITNFHQPGSALLLLVAAFIGEAWRSAYAYALENDFRFLSYGDACLLFRHEPLPSLQEAAE